MSKAVEVEVVSTRRDARKPTLGGNNLHLYGYLQASDKRADQNLERRRSRSTLQIPSPP